jgi:hypothetical protein
MRINNLMIVSQSKNHRNLVKPLSLSMFILLILSMFVFLSTVPTQAATTSYTFGNTAVGTQTNWFVTDRDASKFQLTRDGVVESITAYFARTGFSAKTAIYTDNNGAPGTLIVQSGGKTVSVTGWNTFTITPKTLTAGYYWLCVVSSSDSSVGVMSPTASNTHAWKTTTYANDYPSTFGTPSGYEKTATSIYATYTVTTTTTTSTPTPTTSPNTANLAPLSAWSLTYGTGPQIIKLDTYVTYNGESSIRLDRHTSADVNTARECNSKGFSVKPGDHVVFSCWMKTSASGYGDTNPYSGARIGLDFYNTKRITGLQSATLPENDISVRQHYVNWGTSQWTKRTIDFVVPQTIRADSASYWTEGSQQVPTGLVLWMQVWSSTYGSTDPGQAWFAHPELYINP